MGYSTSFDGVFKFQRVLTHTEAGIIADLRDADRDEGPAGSPDAYLQWEVTPDRDGLQWDNGEKFYCYTEWLKFLCDTYFTPWGVVVNGLVKWAGEDTDDIGLLIVKDNVVEAVAGTHREPGQSPAELAEIVTVLRETRGVLSNCPGTGAVARQIKKIDALLARV